MVTYQAVGWAQQLYTAASTATEWHTGGGIYVDGGTGSTVTIRDCTITAAPDHVWQQWTNVGVTTYHNTVTWQEPVWNAWVEEADQLAELQRQHDELQARREQQSRERLAREQELMENRLVAQVRALELLDALLTPEERAVRVEQQRVEIEGSDGHLYWLEMHRESVHGNIVRTDEHGCSLGRACVAPRMYDHLNGGVMPTADGWVGQYLGLKFDAAEFLSHANWSGVRGCQERVAA